MIKLKRGDIVCCRIRGSTIVGPYEVFDEIRSFTIVAMDDGSYYLYVPHYFCLKGTVVANYYRCKNLGIDPKYLNEEIIYVPTNIIASIEFVRNGLICEVCKELHPYTEANQEDGTFICYSCRSNPYR